LACWWIGSSLQTGITQESNMTLLRDDCIRYLDDLLQVPRFRDYGPNGLQVEGTATIQVLATAATASLAACEAAAAAGAQALLVHHGLFWGAATPVVGPLRRRLGCLVAHNLNLIAYHLPLDAHPEHGNNAVLVRAVGGSVSHGFATHHGQEIGAVATFDPPLPLAGLQRRIAEVTGHAVQVAPGDGRPIRRLGVVTGGGQGHFQEAIAAGCDAFLTGESRESCWHEAVESGIAFLACGHHASEDLAVHALGGHLARQFGIQHQALRLPQPF
jgi:dinuclear metal center YbgI/SA1388 family protein